MLKEYGAIVIVVDVQNNVYVAVGLVFDLTVDAYKIVKKDIGG